MVKIGIPRALFYYYYYYPLWRAFFNSLGLEVILSPQTNKAILDDGVRTTLSEACLPIKVFFGHVIAVADQVDYLFVPRITRVEPKEYICPKFMGLPDMLRARLDNLPILIDTYDPYISMNLIKKLSALGASVVTPEFVSEQEIKNKTKNLPKRLFWTLGKKMIGSALSFCQDKELDGLILLDLLRLRPRILN